MPPAPTQLYDLISRWRSTPEGHLPAMESRLVKSGWGSGAHFFAKLVPCSDIPAEFRSFNGSGW